MIFFTFRSLPWLVALTLLVLVGIRGGKLFKERVDKNQLSQAAPGSPNVLVILVDTLRADHLSSYGYARLTSPNIDEIANQGVLFENAFATSDWTPPSHASIFTGRYTYEHGADVIYSLDDRYPTIAETLYADGYTTGAFIGNFDMICRQAGFGRGFIHFEDYYSSIKEMIVSSFYGNFAHFKIYHRLLGFNYRIDRKLAPDINQSLLKWIDSNRNRPFFAFVNYFDVHPPYIPPQPYRSMFSELESPGGLINTDWDMNHIYFPFTSEQLQGEIDAYDGAIAYVDQNIGVLISELKKRGLEENTIIVITSDHGEMFGEHELFEHHNSLYREVIHVPLILWWPGHVPQGERIDTPVSSVLLPFTLMDLIGDKEQTTFRDPSLRSLWENPAASTNWPDALIEVGQIWWVPEQHLTRHGWMKSIINSKWHYIVHEKFGEELFNWQSDPREMNNLANSLEMQSLISQFRTMLETYQESEITLTK